MNIAEVRISNDIPAKVFVDAVRGAGFRKYDKALQSKVERPDQYGIRLLESAEAAVLAAIGERPVKPHRSDGHRVKDRVSCRLTKPVYRQLQQAQKRCGHSTMQTLVETIILDWLKKEESHVERSEGL